MKLPSWPSPIGYRDINLGLDRVYDLLARLGNPHKKLPPVIHIAGTNGKGSTLAFLRAIVEDAGYKTHVYTSPHLVEFNERIVVAGNQIDDLLLNEVLDECRKAAEIEPRIAVTFFEGITVAAFLAFSRIKADLVLLETGMGGRLDATNVIDNPLLTIITKISLDHTEFLGKTIAKIAGEKAGIIKSGVPVISGKQKESALKVIRDKARKTNSPCFICTHEWKVKSSTKNNMHIDFADQKLSFPAPAMLGNYQIENAGCAIAALLNQKQFKISSENIANGLLKASWPARMQRIDSGKFSKKTPVNYQLFLDGCHNADGSKSVSRWIRSEDVKSLKKHNSRPANYLICGMLKDKDSQNFLKNFANISNFLIGVEIKDEPKTRKAKEIVDIATKIGIKAVTASGFQDALDKILSYHSSDKPARILICGSLYLAGQFLEENNKL